MKMQSLPLLNSSLKKLNNYNMDNKHKAAELVMEFLPIIGQDPYTGIDTAKKCAKAAAKIAEKAQECLFESSGCKYDWDEVIKFIDTF